nr:ATP-dependent Clp protease ATP-binding subunit [Bacteroidaceae bacterium]
MNHTENVSEAYRTVGEMVNESMCELITPEHLLLALLRQSIFEEALFYANSDMDKMRKDLEGYVEQIDHVNNGDEIVASMQLQFVMDRAGQIAASSGRKAYDVPHLVRAIFDLEDSTAHYVLEKYIGVDQAVFMQILGDAYVDVDNEGTAEADIEYGEDEQGAPSWRQFVVCLNDVVDTHNPLIGREEELERTIQVLCRKDKNNPLHVGEPGVGKTALVYGLAQRIVDGNVPPKLKDSKIYSMDMGTLLAGTQFRGDFEKRIKSIMEGVRKEGNAIIYIDEVHSLVGAGQTSDGALDASNMLKPYLESGEVRFIGSTTYQEYNRFFSKSKSLVRRFQQIDILEPSLEEAEKIIEGLKDKYEEFHGVKYAKGVIAYAIDKSAKFINDRFLPDKAIDLLDEAGAYRELHPLLDKNGNPKAKRYQTVDIKLINDVLAKVCKIDSKALREESNEDLKSLAARMKGQIYGQDEAIRQVVEAVQMSKAGLLDDNKPIASLLFVGPTGVGKTEVCKVLAKELGIELVRFDMSEY